ncbi:hypothetical protein GCK32_002670 [Trichostrongylus colubriformis]|uniref:Uncharacterized protein n=1 Tax=Trichostrongylus colubriformis TaxID=6319 RepID=A0AAN8FET3_TRICO
MHVADRVRDRHNGTHPTKSLAPLRAVVSSLPRQGRYEIERAPARSCSNRSPQWELRFEDIPEDYFKHIILEAEYGISETDCVMSYKVEFKPGKTPIYLFNIERKNATRIYGAINGKKGKKPNWHDSDSREFMSFLRKCNGTDIPDHVLKHLKGWLSCKNSTRPDRPLRYYPWNIHGLIDRIDDFIKYRNRTSAAIKDRKKKIETLSAST